MGGNMWYNNDNNIRIISGDLQIKVKPSKNEFTDNSQVKKEHDKKTAFKKFFKAVREISYSFMTVWLRQSLHNPSVVNAQELVCSGNHIDLVRLAL